VVDFLSSKLDTVETQDKLVGVGNIESHQTRVHDVADRDPTMATRISGLGKPSGETGDNATVIFSSFLFLSEIQVTS
jgi:hypothetical protein